MRKSTSKPFDFSLPPDQFRSQHLHAFWERRMLELSALCRITQLESPQLASESGLADVYASIKASEWSDTRALESPEFLLWINTARHFVLRDIHKSLPLGHVRDQMKDLRRIAVATAYINASSYEAQLEIQQDGRVSLPSTGLSLSLGRQHAGETVRLRTTNRALIAEFGNEQFVAPGENGAFLLDQGEKTVGWLRSPRLGWDILLERSFELSYAHCRTNSAWRMHPLDPDYVSRWIYNSEKAFELLSAIESRLWVPVRAVVRSILPIEAPADLNLSGTAADILGCVCTSLPESAGLLAETLAHEAAHTTLHILSDEIQYWNPDDSQLYRSPWRKDPRPLSGMMHGIFAFLSVADFWALLLQSDAIGEFEQLGRNRLRTVIMQVQESVPAISDSPSLSEVGRRLLAAAELKIADLKDISNFYRPDEESERAIHARLTNHRIQHAQPTVSSRTIKPTLDPVWSHKIGVQMPPPPNLAENNIVRREGVSDLVHLAALDNEPVVSEWLAVLGDTRDSEFESAALMEGSILYGQGDFVKAIACYAKYVEKRWEDLDAWRLLRSALRRACRFREAHIIEFDLVKLQLHQADKIREKWGTQWPFHLSEIVSEAGAKHHVN